MIALVQQWRPVRSGGTLEWVAQKVELYLSPDDWQEIRGALRERFGPRPERISRHFDSDMCGRIQVKGGPEAFAALGLPEWQDRAQRLIDQERRWFEPILVWDPVDLDYGKSLAA